MNKIIKALKNIKTLGNIDYNLTKELKDVNNNLSTIAYYLTYLNDIGYSLKGFDKERINVFLKQESGYKEDTSIRPCIYFDNNEEHSVAFHCFNGNMAIVEFSDGKVKEVPVDTIQFLDSQISLNNFGRINDAKHLKRYWKNEECFKKDYERLKKEYPELFVEESENSED